MRDLQQGISLPSTPREFYARELLNFLAVAAILLLTLVGIKQIAQVIRR